MITGDRQYRTTKAQAERFRQAIAETETQETQLSPRMHRAVIEGLKSQLSDLERELEDYETALQGQGSVN